MAIRHLDPSAAELELPAPPQGGMRLAVEHALRWAISDLREDEDDPRLSDTAVEALLSLFAGLDQWDRNAGRPLPHVTAREDGMLTCEWRGGERDLLLLVSRLGETRLHRVSLRPGAPASQEVIPSPGVFELRDALDWFAK